MSRRVASPLVLALSLLAAFGQQSPPGGAGRRTRDFLGLGAEPDKAAAARGEKLYAPNCAFCHGEKARGAEGPNLVRSTAVLHDEKGEILGPLIAKGIPDRGMPAFPSFTKEQLYDVAQYLHLQVELVANRGLYQRLQVVTGDPKAGEASFQKQCAKCHSPTGDLAHVGSKYTADNLQNRMVWPAGGRGGGVPGEGGEGGGGRKDVTVTQASGAVIKGRLKQIDDFNVSLVDSEGRFHSFSRDLVKVEVQDRLAAHRELLAHLTDADMHNLTAYLVTLK